jgi:hypothetical protein
MADRSYSGRHGRWRDRADSIFTDDEGWDRGRGRGEERGFLERAGDEVRSWFGDEEAERRREQDLRGDDSRFERDHARGGPYGTPYGGFGRSEVRHRSGYERDVWDEGSRAAEHGHGGRRETPGRGSGFAGQSRWDDDYRRWRDRQIAQFDQEYEDYCRERQERFDREFDSWRSSRPAEGPAAPRIDSESRDSAGKPPGATRGGGRASATRASTGSSPMTDSTISAGGETGGAARSRGARTRG